MKERAMPQLREPYEKPVDLWCKHAPSQKWARHLKTMDGKPSRYVLVFCAKCERGEIVELREDEGLRD